LRDRERLRRAVIELGIASVVGVKTIEPDPPFDLAAVAWAIATMPRKGYAAVAIGGRLRIAEPRMTRLDADIAGTERRDSDSRRPRTRSLRARL
jgi:protein-L-isoaspartate O-methyltransferase